MSNPCVAMVMVSSMCFIDFMLIVCFTVHNLVQVQGPKYEAVFSLLNSRVQALEFANGGTKLVVGYKCSRVSNIFFRFLLVKLLANTLICLSIFSWSMA